MRPTNAARLSVVLVALASGACVDSSGSPSTPGPWGPPGPEPCSGTPTDNGDGTTTIACDDGTLDVVCTHADCSGVTRLVVEGSDVARIFLSTLERVEGGWGWKGHERGGLQVGSNPNLTTLSAPALRFATLIVIADNPVLADVRLPALEEVEAIHLDVPGFSSRAPDHPPEAIASRGSAARGNRSLSSLRLQALRSAVWVYVGVENDALRVLELPVLTKAQLVVSGTALARLDLPAFVEGTVLLMDLPLSSLGLPALESGRLEVRGASLLESVTLQNLAAGSLVVDRCPELTSVSAPSLVTGEVWLGGNPALSSARLPRLKAGRFTLADNGALSACQALGMLVDLRAAGYAGRAWISGHGTSEGCPALRMCQSTTISSTRDWEALIAGDCEEIAGDLTILGTVATLSPNARVHTIDGGLMVQDNPSLASISMPSLVAGDVSIWSCPAFTTLSLPSLRAGTVVLDRARGLEVLGLPSLQAGDVNVFSCSVLSTLHLPALHTGRVMVDSSFALRDLSLPALTSGGASVSYAPLVGLGLPLLAEGDVYLGSGVQLAQVTLPRLTTGRVHVSFADVRSVSLPAFTSGTLRAEWASSLTDVSVPVFGSGSVYLKGTSLGTLSLPALTSGDLWIEDNGALTHLGAPVLASSTGVTIHGNALSEVELRALRSLSADLTITDNIRYPQCAAEAILAQLVHFTGSATISGNDTSAACSP